MRTLFLTPVLPTAVDSGIRQRISVNLRALASISSVTITGLSPQTAVEIPRSGPLELCQEVHVVPGHCLDSSDSAHANNWRTRLSRRWAHLCDPRPSCTRLLDGERWHEVLGRLLPHRFDLIWVQGLGLYGQLLGYDLPRVVVDLPDAESLKARRELWNGLSDWQVAVRLVDFFKLRYAEKYWGKGDHWFVVCSEHDRREISRSGGKVWVVRNTVPVPVSPITSAEEPDTILFVGQFGYKPNREAAVYLAREILPRILQRRSTAKLYLVGGNPTSEILALQDSLPVVVTGYVSSVEPYYRRSALVVAPVLTGAGTRLKILEAMSYGKVVVATSVGAEGLAVHHRREIMIADSPQVFAQYCVNLLEDANLRSQLGRAAHDFVSSFHNQDQAQEEIRKFLDFAFPLRSQPFEQAPPVQV